MKFFPGSVIALILCGAFTAIQAGTVEFKTPGPNGGATIRISGETIRLSINTTSWPYEGYDFAMLEEGAVTVTLDLGSGPQTYNVIDSFVVPNGTYRTSGRMMKMSYSCPIAAIPLDFCYLPSPTGSGGQGTQLILESSDASAHLALWWGNQSYPGGSNYSFGVSELNATGSVELFRQYITAAQYVFERTYTDAEPNTAPVSNAGPDQLVTQIGTRVYLDPSNSYDDDGQEIASTWLFVSKPAGSAGYGLPGAAFTSNGDYASFVPDIPGDYVLRLQVQDSHVRRSAFQDEVRFTFANVAPVASAGSNQSVTAGDVVMLSGSASDENGNSVTVQWTITAQPAGSLAAISEPTQLNTQFVADMPGLYEVSLVAHDGYLASAPSVAQIVAVTVQSQIINTLNEAIAELNALPVKLLKSEGARDRLTGKIVAAIAEIQSGDETRAIGILSHNVLPSMNGCSADGVPANNDIVQDCAAQNTILPLVIEAINLLDTLN